MTKFLWSSLFLGVCVCVCFSWSNRAMFYFKKKCEKCEQNLNPGEIAISAEHANPLARWHPKCFSCVECNELLTDLLYYNHDGKIFCQKHYDVLTRPKLICAACDLVCKFYQRIHHWLPLLSVFFYFLKQAIESNEYVNAEDHFWHKEHFVCWDCESTLAGKKYIVSDSLPYCLDCHQKSFSKVKKNYFSGLLA